MRFSRYVFIAAGIWGIFILTPLFFLVDVSGRHYPPPTSYPQFVYGFFAIALVWQFVFLVIGADPARFRPLMILAVLEKAAFVIPAAVLYTHGQIPWLDASAAVPDLIFGLLFIAGFFASRR
jgi:hypothetical protein